MTGWRHFLFASASCFLIAPSAEAVSVTWETLGRPDGGTVASVPGLATVTAVGGEFVPKSRLDLAGNFFEAFGLTLEPAGEIGEGQAIIIDFDTPQRIESFVLAFLFPGEAFPELVDIVNEQAMVEFLFSDDSTGQYTLSAMDVETALWSGPSGGVVNLSPGSPMNAGVWQVSDPVGDLAVKRLTFFPTAGFDVDPAAPAGVFSDFAIASVTTVPEPTTLALMAFGVSGLGALGRRGRGAPRDRSPSRWPDSPRHPENTEIGSR